MTKSETSSGYKNRGQTRGLLLTFDADISLFLSFSARYSVSRLVDKQAIFVPEWHGPARERVRKE